MTHLHIGTHRQTRISRSQRPFLHSTVMEGLRGGHWAVSVALFSCNAQRRIPTMTTCCLDFAVPTFLPHLHFFLKPHYFYMRTVCACGTCCVDASRQANTCISEWILSGSLQDASGIFGFLPTLLALLFSLSRLFLKNADGVV